MTGRSPSVARAPRGTAPRPGPRIQRPADGVARALRHRPVGDEPAEVVDPRHVDHRERASQPLDPPAVAAAVQRGPVEDRVAPELALGGERVGRHARLQPGPEQLRPRPVVGAAGRDVDRHVADEPHAALGGVRAQRAPLAVEAHLVLERRPRPPVTRLPPVDPVAPRARGTRPTSSSLTGACGIGEQPGPGGERRARLVRGAVAVGRSERQHLPPRLPGGGQPVHERVGVVVQAAGRQRRRMQLHAGGPGVLIAVSCRFDPAVRGIDVNSCPREQSANRPRGSRSSTRAPIVDCGRYPAKRTVGDAVQSSRPTSSATATRCCAPSSAGAARARRTGSEAPMRHVDAAHAGVRWEGLVHRRPNPAAGRSRSRRGRTRSRRGATELDRKVAAGIEDLSGELSEGVLLLERVGGLAEGADRVTLERALSVVRDTQRADPHPRGGGAGARPPGRRPALARPPGVDDPAAAGRARRRSRACPVRLLVRAVPALVGRLRRRARAAPAARRARLRRPLPAADPPDRPHEPQGRNNSLVAGPGDPGQPVGDRRRDRRPRRASTPTSARSTTSTRSSPTARRVGVEICLDFAIQCSADHPWLTDHPEWFNRRPDGTLKYAENPPKKYQDIYNVNWQSEDWRGLWQALLDVVLFWVTHGVRDLPRRQPAHEADPVLGVADPQGPRPVPRRRLPRRGVHPPGDDAHARQGGLQPVLHVLHLEEHAATSSPST